MLGGKRAINAIIATIILVIISVSFSIFAAFWLGGITKHYQDYEKLEIVSCTCTYSSDVWKITIILENEGNSEISIRKIAINDLDVNAYGSSRPDQGSASTDVPPGGLRLVGGETSVLCVYIDGPKGTGLYGSLSVGTSVNIILYSSSGMEYRAMIVLP